MIPKVEEEYTPLYLEYILVLRRKFEEKIRNRNFEKKFFKYVCINNTNILDIRYIL